LFKRSCQTTKQDGTPCLQVPLLGEDFCFWHHPDHAAEAEVALEFDGEDPLRPTLRAVVEWTAKMLTELHELLNGADAAGLPEPDEAAVDRAWSRLERGRRLLTSL
jgi:hypothetical protein